MQPPVTPPGPPPIVQTPPPVQVGPGDEPQLQLTLALDQPSALRYESIPFSITITNLGKSEVSTTPDPTGRNESLLIHVQSGGNRHSYCSMDTWERSGFHHHEPKGTPTVKLAPGRPLRVRGDLLAWSGGLEPGDHTLTAEYRAGEFYEVLSEPVKLRVLDVSPSMLGSACTTFCGPDSPRILAWVNAGESMLLVQAQSAPVPSSPLAGIKVASVGEVRSLYPAAVMGPSVRRGAVLFDDQRPRLKLAGFTTEPSISGSPAVDVRTSFPGRVVGSPIVSEAGVVNTVFLSETGDKAALLTITPDGKVTETQFDVSSAAPIGAAGAIFDGDARVYFAFVSRGGRQVMLAQRALDETGKAAPPIPISSAPGNVAHIELDLDPAGQPGAVPVIKERLREGEPAPAAGMPQPRVAGHVVVLDKGRLIVTRLDPFAAPAVDVLSLDVTKQDGLRLVHAITRRDKRLAMLLASGNGELYYACTDRPVLRPLRELTKRAIGLDALPHLVAAGEVGPAPYIHLRFIDRASRAIVFMKLDPEGVDEPQPHDHDHDHE